VTARTRRRHKLPAETTQRDLARQYPPILNRRALRANRRQPPTLRHSTARTQESATRNRAPEDPGHAPTNANRASRQSHMHTQAWPQTHRPFALALTLPSPPHPKLHVHCPCHAERTVVNMLTIDVSKKQRLRPPLKPKRRQWSNCVLQAPALRRLNVMVCCWIRSLEDAHDTTM